MQFLHFLASTNNGISLVLVVMTIVVISVLIA